MEYWILYLCGIADPIHTLFRVFGIIGTIVGVISMLFNMCASSPNCDKCYGTCMASIVSHNMKVKGIKVLSISITILLVSCLIPRSKDCYALFGIGTILNYVNNSNEAKKIPDNALKAVNHYLELLTPSDSIQ